jgi:hypothetical protein
VAPDIERVAAVMEHRMNCVFTLTASTGTRHLILGTWGCGVFRNDPDLIARCFVKSLTGVNSWRPFFDRIVFAAFDTTPDCRNRQPFEHRLEALNDLSVAIETRRFHTRRIYMIWGSTSQHTRTATAAPNPDSERLDSFTYFAPFYVVI